MCSVTELVADVRVKVRFLAVLKGLAERDFLETSLPAGSTLIELAELLAVGEGSAIRKRLLNKGGDSLAPDMLVFLDGVEASMLGGGMARLDDVKEVVFLPSVHGG